MVVDDEDDELDELYIVSDMPPPYEHIMLLYEEVLAIARIVVLEIWSPIIDEDDELEAIIVAHNALEQLDVIDEADEVEEPVIVLDDYDVVDKGITDEMHLIFDDDEVGGIDELDVYLNDILIVEQEMDDYDLWVIYLELHNVMLDDDEVACKINVVMVTQDDYDVIDDEIDDVCQTDVLLRLVEVDDDEEGKGLVEVDDDDYLLFVIQQLADMI